MTWLLAVRLGLGEHQIGDWKSSFCGVRTNIHQCCVTSRMDIDVCCELSFGHESVIVMRDIIIIFFVVRQLIPLS